MAKTKFKNGKKSDRKEENGDVLVMDPPPDAAEQLEDPGEDDSDEPEDEAAAHAQPVAPDPRRIPFSTTLKATELWAFIAQYPAPQDLDLYVYRLFPVIKALPPPDWLGEKKAPTYQEKLKGLITEQTGRVPDYNWLRDVRGSGKYHLRLIDRRLKRTQNRQICEAVEEVNEWDTHPPVLNDWAELVPVEANKWIIARLLKDKVIRRNPEGGFVAYDGGGTNNANNQNGSDPATLLDKTVGLATRLAQTMTPKTDPSQLSGTNITELIKTVLSTNDPNKQVATLKDLVEIAKPEPADDGVVKLMLAQLAAEREERAAAREREAAAREREFQIMKEMLKPADTTAEITKIATLAKTLKEAFGGEDSPEAIRSRMTGWQEFLQPILTPLAQPLGFLISHIGEKFIVGQPPAGAPSPRPPAPTATIQPAPPNGQTTQPTGEPVPDPRIVVVQAVLAQMTPTMLTYLDDGEPGDAFAAWVWDSTFSTPFGANVKGPDVMPIARQLGKDALVEAYKNNPQVWPQLVHREKQFVEFIDQFLAANPASTPTEEPEPVRGKKGK